MSRMMLVSDAHLGHKNIHKFRNQFSTAEEHHETIFDNIATNINKRDHLIALGDMAFDTEWLYKFNQIRCLQKTIILGNHDTERVHITDIVNVFNNVHGLWSKKNCWFSHCPIHPQELRRRHANIHGHLHAHQVFSNPQHPDVKGTWQELDERYINVCLEWTDYKPIDFETIKERIYDTD